MRIRWPFMKRSTYEATQSLCAQLLTLKNQRIAELHARVRQLEAEPDVNRGHVRNLRNEVQSARDTLDRVLSWKAPE